MEAHKLENRIFGKLRVVRKVESTRSGMTRWECVCDCGNTTKAATKHLLKGSTKSCGCSQQRSGSDHAQWGGVGELSGNIWNQIVRHSLSRGGVPITITKEYAWDLFETQKRRCALSGVKIFLRCQQKRTASLDRINSGLGYIPGNVQWVHKDINRMKNVFSQEYFIDMCRMVSENNK